MFIAFVKEKVAMNYLLKNGDAHLKNFGLLFDDDFKNIWYLLVYYVVSTVVYIHKDKLALMLDGKNMAFNGYSNQIWTKNCLLSLNEAKNYYKECIEVLKWAIDELKNYLHIRF